MNRRAFLVAAAASLALPAFARTAAATDAKPTLVYLSAEDCPTCRYWERRFEAKFKASEEFKTVTFRTVMVHSLTNLREKARWPADLEWLRVLSPEKATPRFFLVKDKKILVRGDGIDGWTDVIEPRLKKMAAAG